MTRRDRRGAAWLAALSVVVLAACSGDDGGRDGAQPFEFSGAAATVDGHDIPAQEIADQIQVFKTVPGSASVALQVDQLTQEGTDEPTPEAVADILGTEVAVTAIQNELGRRNLQLTPASREVADIQVRGSFGSLADQLPPEFLQRTIDRYAAFVTLDQELAPKFSDEELRAEYTANPTDYERTCVRHILTERPEEAEAVLVELRAGADFVEVARTRSKDPLSAVEGGDLGCVPRGSFAAAFETAAWEGPVGELQGPVVSEYGTHVVQVTRRGVAAFEEVREDVVAAMSAEPFTSLGIWLQLNLPKAAIQVDPRFGVWDAASGRVLPRGTTSAGLSVRPAPGGGPPTTAGAPAPTTTAPFGGSTTTGR